MLRSYLVLLREDGVAARSINRKASSYKSYYNWCLVTNRIESSPLELHQSLKTKTRQTVPFSESEVQSALQAIDHDGSFASVRDALIIQLLYTTGMRRAELIGLDLLDVDIAGNYIKVTGKRDKQRIVPLLQPVKLLIKQYLPLRQPLCNVTEPAFIVSQFGKRCYPKLVYRVINEYFSEASTKLKCSPHVLRHAFATQLLDEGAHLNAVKELLGHASLASTQVYTHSSMAKLKGVHRNAHPRNQRTNP